MKVGPGNGSPDGNETEGVIKKPCDISLPTAIPQSFPSLVSTSIVHHPDETCLILVPAVSRPALFPAVPIPYIFPFRARAELRS